MELCVNGEKLHLRDGATISELLVKYKLEPVRVAVELNRAIVPKKAYPNTGLKSGDTVEIVTFVGGG
ncbi:ThiS, thiamine-biosynthesis [mine drainage metagenome]|uniref:ThiS, thiamine-biosynthesis n=1 Tax=mine drainage metagenome TaxID=410659 RepID=T0ZEY1_9ZZZZ